MIPTKGIKEDKIRAAFEYADLFMKESDKFGLDEEAEFTEKDYEYARKNPSILSRLRGKSE